MRPLGTTVMASQVRAVVEGAARAGLEHEALLAASGISAEELASPEARVPFATEVRLWQEIERRFPGEPVGLMLAPFAFDAEAFGAVGFAARTSANLGAAFAVAVRYCRVTNESTVTRLVRENDGARLIDGPSNRREPWPRAKAEFVLAGYVILGRRWTGLDWRPREVRFQHVAPANLEPYRTLFQAHVAFRQPRNELLFDASLLDQPLLHADPQLSAFLCRQADLLANGIGPTTNLIDLVRSSLARELPSGLPTMSTVARQFGLSQRTLQRRLTAVGTCYNEVLDEARREVALRCIVQPGTTEAQLAFLTGFSVDRAFRRAFRRWTGYAPVEWRAQELASSVRLDGARGPSR